MEFNKIIKLKDGRTCVLRNAQAKDSEAVLYVSKKTHEETDFMLAYPDEGKTDIKGEEEFLEKRKDSKKALMLCAVVDNKIVATCGFDSVGNFEKISHRAEFGIGVLKDYWNLGIGRSMTEASIECAKKCGYVQLELDVVSNNKSAYSLYKSLGFTEYGRNPKGFKSRYTGWQELVLMKLDLTVTTQTER